MRFLVGPRGDAEPCYTVAFEPLGVGGIQRMGEAGAFGGEGEVLAFVGEELVCPNFPGDFDNLAEESAVFLVLSGVGVGVELGPFVRPDPPAETDFDPSSCQVIENCNVLSESDGVPPGGDVGHLPYADAGGAGSEVGAKEDWVGDVPGLVWAEVVLAKPHGLETEFLGEKGLLSQIVQQVGCVGGVACGLGHGSKSRKLHDPFSLLGYPAGVAASSLVGPVVIGEPTVTLGTRLLMLQRTS